MIAQDETLAWLVFGVAVTVMLVLDLAVLHRKGRHLSTRAAAIWSVVWVLVSLAFAGYVWADQGGGAAQVFLAGYLIEKALSVDNLLVFFVLFNAFRVPVDDQQRVLFWGVLGAIAMRTGMIFGGVWMLDRWHWLIYPFAVVLAWTGLKMLRHRQELPHPEQSRLMRFVRRLVPTTDGLRGHHFIVVENGRRLATPLLTVLVLVELTDVAFALDSILAIFAITTDPFLVLTSNVLALLGMRALYVVLAELTTRFDYLQPGLALVLLFVAFKMAASEWIEVPVVVSLSVVVLLLAGSLVGSMMKNRRDQRRAAV